MNELDEAMELARGEPTAIASKCVVCGLVMDSWDCHEPDCPIGPIHRAWALQKPRRITAKSVAAHARAVADEIDKWGDVAPPHLAALEREIHRFRAGKKDFNYKPYLDEPAGEYQEMMRG